MSKLLIILLIACAGIKAQDKSTQISLTYQVVPEDNNGGYYVEWDDTLGQAAGYLPEKFLHRPKEIWCTITNEAQDTLGYYYGRSMAADYCYFQTTTDSVIILNFSIGMNMFPDIFEDASEEEILAYLKRNPFPIDLEPIRLNLQENLRKETQTVLRAKG